MFNKTFIALLEEAQFTKEMLGAGATQIRSANYATKGVYFQSFTSLSTGLERIGKLCLMLDYYIQNNGTFPEFVEMKKKIGHDLSLLYCNSQTVAGNRSVYFSYLKNLDEPIQQSILTILSSFAMGDRYSNINLLTGRPSRRDPIATWFEEVDAAIWESHVSDAKKKDIFNNAGIVAGLLGGFVRTSFD